MWILMISLISSLLLLLLHLASNGSGNGWNDSPSNRQRGASKNKTVTNGRCTKEKLRYNRNRNWKPKLRKGRGRKERVKAALLETRQDTKRRLPSMLLLASLPRRPHPCTRAATPARVTSLPLLSDATPLSIPPPLRSAGGPPELGPPPLRWLPTGPSPPPPAVIAPGPQHLPLCLLISRNHGPLSSSPFIYHPKSTLSRGKSTPPLDTLLFPWKGNNNS